MWKLTIRLYYYSKKLLCWKIIYGLLEPSHSYEEEEGVFRRFRMHYTLNLIYALPVTTGAEFQQGKTSGISRAVKCTFLNALTSGTPRTGFGGCLSPSLRDSSWSSFILILLSFGSLLINTISSAKRRWFNYTPSTLIPIVSQCNFLNTSSRAKYSPTVLKHPAMLTLPHLDRIRYAIVNLVNIYNNIVIIAQGKASAAGISRAVKCSFLNALTSGTLRTGFGGCLRLANL
ncbi:hypothetical protein HUJ05_012216 [Dendroctonus ponderosae]|nr:hypothetical protein HUJ05_012216 [Dendroctonus ponderosae]